MKIIILIVTLLLVIGFGIWFFLFSNRAAGEGIGNTLSIENKVTYDIEVRRTVIEQAMGLSGRESLSENQGMVFVYSRPSKQSFWMKDMNFALDFIWIRDGQIIGLNEQIPYPDINGGEIARLASPGPVDAILEVNAGQISKYGIEVGDKVRY